MPPTLDLTKTYTHADMILSSRNSPRISLRRAASYNANDRGPQSSTSSRFSFNHLLATPPPSPGLPALIPRHGKPVPAGRKHVRVLVWLVGVLVILFYASSLLRSSHRNAQAGWSNHAGEHFEMVGDEQLPDFPTPVVVLDKKGRSRWTVSIPPDTQFPLEPKVYREICLQNREVAAHVLDLHTQALPERGYYWVDPNFMDVAEAERSGLLPGPKAKTNMKVDGVVGENLNSLIEEDVCRKSLTFLLETDDAGLGTTLMMLWMAYGLAEKEGREFFIDDSRWYVPHSCRGMFLIVYRAYGKYTNFFQSPPMPKCRPPPRHEMLPCPHHARHLIVSAATAQSTFGSAFEDRFQDVHKLDVFRQKPIFDLASVGYQALFHLSSSDAAYVQKRIDTFENATLIPSTNRHGMTIGLHVRHGDKHPSEFQYQDSYIPLDRYASTARTILQTNFDSSLPNGEEDLMAEMHSLFILASDDPDVYESEEFSHARRAQELIHLASHTSASAKPKSASAIRKFVDETVGWEGGFFAGMFWSLGKPSSVPATGAETPDTNLPPTAEALRLRELVGRAYLLDLAVVGQSDRVVCAVSSMGCRLLAVMMGWEDAMVRELWWNVDGGFAGRGWKGLDS